MVCDRCILVVNDLFEKEAITTENIELGKVVISQPLGFEKLDSITKKLHQLGFEIIDNEQNRITNEIKTLIIQLIASQEQNSIVLSQFLTQNLHYEYGYLSSIFSAVTSTTIEKFYILQRIEKAKELLSYGQLTLSQIADALGYKNLTHLSAQFKKITGITPTEFKKSTNLARKPLDKIA